MASSQAPASQRRYSNAELLMLVRRVALTVSPEAPETVSQRAFNAARREVTEHCPEAAYLVKRLRCPWPELLSLAFSDERTSNKSLLMRDREYTGNRAAYIGALQLIARRLEVTTLRPGQYDEAREEMLKKSRGRHRQELLERLHPAGAIDAHGWDELLALAGLVPRKREGVSPGLPVPDAVERFLEAQGRLPKLRELYRFAKERGFALRTTKKILPHIEELRSRRTEEGLWTPARLPKPSARPPWQAPEPGDGEDPEHPRPRRGHWTLERIQAGLQLALAELEPGETLTLPTLRRLAKTHRDIPSSGVVSRVAEEHGTTISALRAEAIARRHSASQ